MDAAGTPATEGAVAATAVTLGAELPVALLPVRLEARFDAGALLVRIYPDAFHLDTHEPGLTAGELAAGNRFWQAVNGTDATARLTAWDALAGPLGPERAAWVAVSTKPGIQPPPQATRTAAWTRGAIARALPSAWRVTGYLDGAVMFDREFPGPTQPGVAPLQAGPSPQPVATPADDVAALEPGLAWMVDFNQAVTRGMAVRIPMDATSLVRGYDRVVVVGLDASGAAPGASVLDGLLQAHYYSDGLAFVPQGTPTNNSAHARAGGSRADPAYVNAYHLGVTGPLPATPGAGAAALDLMLGLAPDPRKPLALALGADDDPEQGQRLMNTLLWAPTLGYFLAQMMADTFTPDQVRAGRRHFIEHVRADGPLPLLRAGSQPYGILPVIALDPWAALEDEDPIDAPLTTFLRALRAVWLDASQRVPRTGGGGDPAATLVRLLSMDPMTRSYAARNLLGEVYANNLWRVLRLGLDQNWQANQQAQTYGVLASLGVSGWQPRLAEAVFATTPYPLGGPLVADPPDGTAPEYIAWLVGQSADTLRNAGEHAPDGGATPLLYRLLRHALMLEYWFGAQRLQQQRGVQAPLDPHEPELIDFWNPSTMSPSPTLWRRLAASIRLSSGAVMPVRQYIDGVAGAADDPDLDNLRQFRQALEDLVGLPAEPLERLMGGTLDLAAYRLDAWITAMATKRLRRLRELHSTGIHVGAYGWLENLRPATWRTPVPQPPPGEASPPGLATDMRAAGYLHAPSPAQAITAAILRSGHHASGGAASYAVDLSSDRVRLARTLLAGVRQGQPLGALLGYRFERGLHEHPRRPALDRYIAPFRLLAPMLGTRVQLSGAPQEAVAAHDIVDGLALWLRSTTIPWGSIPPAPPGMAPTAQPLPAQGSADYLAVNQVLADLGRAVDALADLGVAEGVHQVVQGNTARLAGLVDALARSEAPPQDFDVLRTPRSGIALTHRVLVLAESGASPSWPLNDRQARAVAEPALAAWAARLLGLAAAIVANATWTWTAADGTVKHARVSLGLDQLNLSPLDLIAMAERAEEPQLPELDRWLLVELGARRTAVAPEVPPADARLDLDLGRDPSWPALPAPTLSVAEALELARAARALLEAGRAATGADLAMPGAQGDGLDQTLLRSRANAVADVLTLALTRFAEAGFTGTGTSPGGTPPTAATLRGILLRAAHLGVAGAVPQSAFGESAEDLAVLTAQATAARAELARRKAALDALDDAHFDREHLPPAAIRDHDVARIRAVLGDEVVLLPPFTPANRADLAAALGPQASATLQGGDASAVLTWMMRLARVRQGVDRLHTALTYSDATGRDERLTFRVAQLPFPNSPGERWVALPFPAGGGPAGSRLSLVAHRSGVDDLTAGRPTAALVVDEWVEVLPRASETTGLAFNFDAPDAQPPQAILLAVSPDQSPSWTLEALRATVLEALDLAHVRAVDPESLDEVGHYLPALYFAVNLAGDTAATDFTHARSTPGSP